MPAIPVIQTIYFMPWNQTYWTGYPTAENPYANPAPGTFPDLEVVLINLHKK